MTPEDDILLYLYFGEKTVLRSVCTSYTGIGWQSFHQTGDYAETRMRWVSRSRSGWYRDWAHDPYPLHFAAGVCDISVLADDEVQLIALFGDSITHMSFFMDPLLERLCAWFSRKICHHECRNFRKPTAEVSSCHAGLSG